MFVRSKRGFTLIELLVVIAIIGILSSVVLASLSAARTRAYDAKRKSDLKQMQIALELYYDRFNSYPVTPCGFTGPASPACVSSDWIPGLVSGGFIASLPSDPQYPQRLTPGPCSGNWPSMYLYYSATGTGYKLMAHCPFNSNVVTTPSSDAFYDPVRPTWALQVCSGNECSI